MYKKNILIALAIIAISGLIAILIAKREKTFPRKMETIESTNHVRMLKEIEITRLTDDLEYGLSMVNIGDSIKVLVYNGPSKSSMVVINKKKQKREPIKEEQIPLNDELYAEKHFDCYVEEVIGKGEYVTECGIAFTSDKKYKKGQTLKNFTSPKHK